jgi:hypothetical protein
MGIEWFEPDISGLASKAFDMFTCLHVVWDLI